MQSYTWADTNTLFAFIHVPHIGIGTGEAGEPAPSPPPPQIFYPRDSLIFIHAAQITANAVYTFAPLPKMKLLPMPMTSPLYICTTCQL